MWDRHKNAKRRTVCSTPPRRLITAPARWLFDHFAKELGRLLSACTEVSARLRSLTTLRPRRWQTQTRSPAGHVGDDDGPADGSESPVLSAAESIAARAWVRRFRRNPVRQLLRRDDGSARLVTGHLFPAAVGYFEGI